MKTLTQFTKKIKTNIVSQPDSVNYLSIAELNKYLDTVKIFLMDETKNIIKYLIDNNTSYISELSTDNDENALVGFYNTGIAKNEDEKNLKEWIKVINDNQRLLEIPTLLTQKQFDDIVSKRIAPDIIYLNLTTENGRNNIVKKYEPLIHKICRQFHGKSNFTYDDLISIAYEGLTYAMNSYGKTKTTNTEKENDAIKNYTFGQYAAYVIRNVILDNIKNYSHTVRIPISQQQKEKKTTGRNTKSNTISGNKVVGHNDEGNKTIFDFMSDTSDPSKKLNQDDMKRLWDEIFTELEEKFEKKIIELFYSFYGINGYKKLKSKEISQKYNVMPSQVTYYCVKVRNYILENKKILNKFKEVYELMKECLNDFDQNSSNDPIHINL